jgi:hypothetical protein
MGWGWGGWGLGGQGAERLQSGKGDATKTEPVVLPKRNWLYYQNGTGCITKNFIWHILVLSVKASFFW